MSAVVNPSGTEWRVSCEPCGWEPADGYPDRERAEWSAGVHNSDVHLTVPRPEWGDVARWADAERAGVSS
jgi:hypothetical protein